jgi:hypothetical protein
VSLVPRRSSPGSDFTPRSPAHFVRKTVARRSVRRHRIQAAEMHNLAGFRLRKWYLDAVSVDGEVFVGYQARLEFRQLSVQHASFLLSPQRGSGRGASTWTRAPSPESGSSGIRWSLPRLGVRGTWTGNGASISRRLFHSNEGMVDWNCLLPAASVCLDFSDGQRLEGQGYAEVLEMTIPPWRRGAWLSIGQNL